MAVAELFKAYMQETFGTDSAMSPDVLLRDGMGLHFNLIVALDVRQQPAGFAAWRMAYDLHHAVAGGEVPDLFVAHRHRGRGLSIRLLAAVAQEVQLRGGTYIKGEVLTDDPRRMQLLPTVSSDAVFTNGAVGSTYAVCELVGPLNCAYATAPPIAAARMLAIPIFFAKRLIVASSFLFPLGAERATTKLPARRNGAVIAASHFCKRSGT